MEDIAFETQPHYMFRAIGTLIVLWGFSQFFSSSFQALDSAATETFKALEAAAITSQNELERIQ